MGRRRTAGARSISKVRPLSLPPARAGLWRSMAASEDSIPSLSGGSILCVPDCASAPPIVHIVARASAHSAHGRNPCPTMRPQKIAPADCRCGGFSTALRELHHPSAKRAPLPRHAGVTVRISAPEGGSSPRSFLHRRPPSARSESRCRLPEQQSNGMPLYGFLYPTSAHGLLRCSGGSGPVSRRTHQPCCATPDEKN